MVTRFTLPHIDISAVRRAGTYLGQSGGGGSTNQRIREEHGRRLLNELNAVYELANQEKATDDRLPQPEGIYLEVDLRKGTKVDVLERKSIGVKPGATTVNEKEVRTVALYVPNSAKDVFKKILEDYTDGPLTEKGQQPPKAQTVDPIETFRKARIETFWTDAPERLPTQVREEIWWALWCWPGSENNLLSTCEKLGLRVATDDRWLFFPEAIVIPVLATRAAIELLLFSSCSVAELRRASDNPVFFIDEARGEQSEWTEDLATRITWPGTEAPSICILDTGINRAHSLIEPALSTDDMHALDPEWGTDDHDTFGHGTGMAGLALHGDLTASLADQSQRTLLHRLESVKLLPPVPFPANDPQSYGVLTQAAVAIPEITAPDRNRTFCMAVSNEDVSGYIPSTWSAAVDQAAAGTMIGDGENGPRRLFILSAGNVTPEIDAQKHYHPDEYPIEDPGQAWNALTVGGYTDLIEIHEEGYQDWTALAPAGDISPYSRTSVTWPHNKTPFKPDIVLEAGNRAINPKKTEILGLDSLSLLTTGHEVDRLPLVSFQATSAAAAQAARLAARISVANTQYWPETVRALLVHSADWTSPMISAFERSDGKRNNYELVRRYGYGVPSLERALASANNDLALFTQVEIQPFLLKGTRKFNECHYYDLPLPNAALEQLNNEIVELKITLSYFIDPNPGLSANIDPQRYQSFGLRFDLRRKNEPIDTFHERVNAAEREDPKIGPQVEPDDDRWLLGPKGISAGSLHCDVWKGPAVELLTRDTLCIKPVTGWWRNRASAEYCNRRTRYALVVSLKTANTTVDLHTPIDTAIYNRQVIQTAISVKN